MRKNWPWRIFGGLTAVPLPNCIQKNPESQPFCPVYHTSFLVIRLCAFNQTWHDLHITGSVYKISILVKMNDDNASTFRWTLWTNNPVDFYWPSSAAVTAPRLSRLSSHESIVASPCWSDPLVYPVGNTVHIRNNTVKHTEATDSQNILAGPQDHICNTISPVLDSGGRTTGTEPWSKGPTSKSSNFGLPFLA